MTLQIEQSVRLCECGCGESIPSVDRRGRPHRFLYGHNMKGKLRLNNRGTNNSMWKGDNVKRNPLHRYVRSYLPQPELCQECNRVPPKDFG